MTGEETVKALDDKWFKILAIFMHKQGVKQFVLSEVDVKKFTGHRDKNIVCQELADGLHIRLVSDQEAISLQQAETSFMKFGRN